MVIALAEPRVLVDLLQRAIFAVRIDDQDCRAVMRHEQFFEQDAGKIALSGAGAGEHGKVSRDDFTNGKDDRHVVASACQERADVRATGLALSTR